MTALCFLMCFLISVNVSLCSTYRFKWRISASPTSSRWPVKRMSSACVQTSRKSEFKHPGERFFFFCLPFVSSQLVQSGFESSWSDLNGHSHTCSCPSTCRVDVVICLSTTVRNDTLQEAKEQRVSLKCRKQLRVEELEMVPHTHTHAQTYCLRLTLLSQVSYFNGSVDQVQYSNFFRLIALVSDYLMKLINKKMSYSGSDAAASLRL